MIEQAQFLLWKKDAVTRAFFARLKEIRLNNEEGLLMESEDQDGKQLARYIARINLIDAIMRLELDSE